MLAFGFESDSVYGKHADALSLQLLLFLSLSFSLTLSTVSIVQSLFVLAETQHFLYFGKPKITLAFIVTSICVQKAKLKYRQHLH